MYSILCSFYLNTKEKTTSCALLSSKPVMKISSTYTSRKIVCSLTHINKEVSVLPPLNPSDLKNSLKRWNHILRDCLNSYKDFFNKHTISGCVVSWNLSGWVIIILPSRSPLRNTFEISIWFKHHPLVTAIVSTDHIVTSLTTRMNISW